MQIPPPGDYKAKTNGRIEIGFASTGALCVTVPCVISQGEHAGFTCEWLGVLFKKDETPMQNTIDNLKQVFGWDGINPFWLRNQDQDNINSPARTFPDVEFTLAQCEHEQYEGKTRFKPGFLNAENRRIQLKPATQKEVMAKYGARFRALAGGSPVKAAAAPSAQKTTAAPASTPAATGCTKDEAWQAFTNDRPGAEHEKIWHTAVAEYGKGRHESTFTPQDWANVRDSLLGDNQVPN